MEKFDYLIQLFNDLNLNLDHEGLVLLKNYINQGKRVGIIGLNSDITLPIETIERLAYHPDLFDLSKQFSNINSVLEELEKNFDLVVLISNKNKIYSSKIPIIKLSPKNLILEIQGNPDTHELNQWLLSINIDLSSIKTILRDMNNEIEFLKECERKSLDYLSLQEKNEYLIEEAQLKNSKLYLFEEPLSVKKPFGNLNYFGLINPFFITREETIAIKNSKLLFIEKSLSELIVTLDIDIEFVIYTEENLKKILEKALLLIKDSQTVSIIYKLGNTSEIRNQINNYFKDYSDSLVSYSSINWINVIETTFNLSFTNYLKFNLEKFLQEYDQIINLLKSNITLILEINKKSIDNKLKELYNILFSVFQSDKKVYLFNIETGLAYQTTLEFLEITNDNTYIII